jgi:hypothetical protein
MRVTEIRSLRVIGLLGVWLIAGGVHADMYRCQTAEGVVYQEMPCKGMTVIRMPEASPAVPSPASGSKHSSINDEAYRKYLASGDYSRAAAFATSDAQRAEVQRRRIEKEKRCQLLAIKVQEAEANNKHRGGRFQHHAEALQQEYGVRCGH